MDFLGFVAFGLLLVLLPVLAIVFLLGKLAEYLTRLATPGRQDQIKWGIRAKYGTYLGLFIFLTYSTYTAIYPNDGFFLSEFKEVTLREPPKSSNVVAKSASYPDFHGDYCSYSRIELSPSDYSTLLAEIATDSRLEKGDPMGNSEEQNALRSMPVLQYKKSFTRTEPGKDDHYLGIKFMSTGKHVEVSICVT
ncbi:MAG TPA: hypothetical protein VFK88_11070 [Gallionella sp.]|nr:hypothetical protein [Gallionella sp.]